MDITALLLIILIPLAIYLIFKQQNSSKNIKSQAVKKEEIIESYEKQMRDLIKKYENDNSKLLQEKTKLLKKINYELSMNLFFDEEEAKEIIQKLLKIK